LEKQIEPRLRSQLRTISGCHVQLQKLGWDLVRAGADRFDTLVASANKLTAAELIEMATQLKEALLQDWDTGYKTLCEMMDKNDTYAAVNSVFEHLNDDVEEEKRRAIEQLWEEIHALVEASLGKFNGFSATFASLRDGQALVPLSAELEAFLMLQDMLLLLTALPIAPPFFREAYQRVEAAILFNDDLTERGSALTPPSWKDEVRMLCERFSKQPNFKTQHAFTEIAGENMKAFLAVARKGELSFVEDHLKNLVLDLLVNDPGKAKELLSMAGADVSFPASSHEVIEVSDAIQQAVDVKENVDKGLSSQCAGILETGQLMVLMCKKEKLDPWATFMARKPMFGLAVRTARNYFDTLFDVQVDKFNKFILPLPSAIEFLKPIMDAVDTWSLEAVPWVTVKDHTERNNFCSMVDIASKRWNMWLGIHQRLVSGLKEFGTTSQIERNSTIVTSIETHSSNVQEARELMAHAVMVNVFCLQGEEAAAKTHIANAKRYIKDAFQVSVFKGAKLNEKLKFDDDVQKPAAVVEVVVAPTAAASSSGLPAPTDGVAEPPPKKKPRFLQKK